MDRVSAQFSGALSNGWGWMIGLLTIAATFVSPEKTSFIVVAGAIFADMFWGIAAAIKLNKFILSKALRETIKKIGIYAFALVGALAIEKVTHTEGSFIAVRAIAVFASICEFWSMSASMLIVYPNMPFLKLLRGQLKGEIQSKVSKNVDIDDILNDDTNDTRGDKKHSDIRNGREN